MLLLGNEISDVRMLQNVTEAERERERENGRDRRKKSDSEKETGRAV